MLGVPVEVGNESIWAREGGFDYAQMDRLDFSPQNPWRRKYLELVAALSDRYRGRVPVGQPILRGSSDMAASLRGSQQMIFDFYDCPDLFQKLAAKCTQLIIELVEEQHRLTGPSPAERDRAVRPLGARKIIRMQEDASALFSPGLYGSCFRRRPETGGGLPLQPDPPPRLLPSPDRSHFGNRGATLHPDQ